MLIWGAMDLCLPGCRFCRLISTTCTLGLWRGGLELEVVGEVGKGKGLGVVVRTLGVVVVVKMERIEFGAVTVFAFRRSSLDSCVWSGD